MNAKARVLDWLERADFNNTGCRHSQDTIGLAIGVCRRTVIRALADLEQDGLITVDRPRKRGVCNTYRVRDWNPNRRVDVLNRLAEVRLLRAQCHTKENCRPSRAHTPPTPPTVGSQWKDQRCGCAREETRKEPIDVATPIEVVRDRLDAGGWQPNGPTEKFRALCPAHNDRSNPALIVSERDDSSVGIFCLASCETTAVVAALGLEMRDLFVPAGPGRPAPRRRRPKRPDKPTPKQIDQMLATEGYPVDRVLARLAPNYRCTPTAGFWTADCRVCAGDLWIHAELDDESKPSGPVTLSCANGCYIRKEAGRVR